MQAAGLFKVLQPKRWGGYELDIHTYFDMQMALGEGDMSVAWVYGVVGVHPWFVALLDDRAAQDIWGEDDTTLICSSLMPTGRGEAGRRRLPLQRPLEIRQRLRALRLGVSRRHGRGQPDDRRIFLVPRSDYEIVDTWHVPGLKGTGSHDIVVKDAFVPAHRTQKYADNFRGVAPGLAVNTAPLYRLPFGQVFFRGVSTGAIGALQGMLDAYLEYGKKRIQRNVRRPASEDAVIQLLCAETAVAHRRDEDHPAPQLHRCWKAMPRAARCRR